MVIYVHIYNSKGVEIGYAYSTMHCMYRARKLANSKSEEVYIKKHVGTEKVAYATVYPK